MTQLLGLPQFVETHGTYRSLLIFGSPPRGGCDANFPKNKPLTRIGERGQCYLAWNEKGSSTMSKYRYNYAVIDPAYPADQPEFWSLAGMSLGDAEKINWTFDFAPDADATTELLLSNLSRSGNKITIAIPVMGIPSTEPKWQVGTFYDQLLIEVGSDAEYSVKRKLVFYHVRVLRVKQTGDRGFHLGPGAEKEMPGPVKVILCQVGRGGYVFVYRKTGFSRRPETALAPGNGLS